MYSLIIALKDTLRETHEPTFEAVEHLAGQAANGSLERRLADLEISVRKRGLLDPPSVQVAEI